MKGFLQTKVVLLLAALLLLGPIGSGFNQPSEAASASQINTWTQTALGDFRTKVPQANTVLKEAKGLLVFPHLYNGALVWGGKYGQGELLINGKVQGYYNLVGLSWGLQIGGQRKSLIIAFMTNDALQKFQASNGWDIGGDATVAVIDAGTQGTFRVSEVNKPILAFVVGQKGLMAGLSLQGSKITKINK